MVWIKRLALLFVFLSLALVGLSYYVAQQMAKPGFYQHRTPEQGLKPIDGLVDPRTSFNLAFDAVEFPAVDGQTLRGWFIPAEPDTKSVVIAVHGGGSDRRSFLSFAPSLHAAGYPTLLFDNREHGISDGKGLGMSLGMRESEDITSAIDYLQGCGFERFAVVGNSQGATSAIVAAARDPRISLVVAQGTGTDLEDMMQANPALAFFPRPMLTLFAMHFYFLQDADWPVIKQGGPWPIDVIHEIAPRPLLIIQGEQDRTAPLALARKNFEAAGEPKFIWVVEGGAHRGLREFAGDAYDERIVQFLNEFLAIDANRE